VKIKERKSRIGRIELGKPPSAKKKKEAAVGKESKQSKAGHP
jgi:hypothetical protein